MPIVACIQCGKMRNITLQQMTRPKFNGLCTDCNRKSHSGSSNPNWKNGRRLGGQDGEYILQYIPEHPKADSKGYVLEHRLVAEKMLGRPLTEQETIHHLDNDPTNNDEHNIIVLANQSCHAKLHKFIEKTASIKDKEWRQILRDTITVKDAECQARVERIKSELENLFEPTVPMSLAYKKWRAYWHDALKKREERILE